MSSIRRETSSISSHDTRNVSEVKETPGTNISPSLRNPDGTATIDQSSRLSDTKNEGSRNTRNAGGQKDHTPPDKQVYTILGARTKLFVMVMAAGAAFFSPLSGNIYYPALNSLAAEFNVSSSKINLTLTVYMIMQGLAPTIFGDFADMCGRRPAYMLGFALYMAANIGIALVDSFAGLMVLRCLQSAGSSGMIALASGVAADISTSGERGKYMGWVLSGAMVGPAIGPVIGGLLAEYLGWRSIFWFLVILAGCFLVPFVTAFPETGRNVVGNGSIPSQSWNKSFFDLQAKRQKLKGLTPEQRTRMRESDEEARERLASKRELRIPNPLNALRIICQPDAAVLLAFNSINFAAFYDISASLPYLLRRIYGFNELQIGLCFLPFGVGCFMAPLFNGPLLDWRFRRVARKVGVSTEKTSGTKLNDCPIERARLPIAWPMSTVAALTVICYGWVMEQETHLAAPLVLLFIMGACFVASANVCSTLIVDYNPVSPSTATAANNLCRCLFSAGATAVIVDMIEAMGRGWCFTFIGLMIIAASPLLLVILKWGPGWRAKRENY
jgi:multidrug resistance protein